MHHSEACAARVSHEWGCRVAACGRERTHRYAGASEVSGSRDLGDLPGLAAWSVVGNNRQSPLGPQFDARLCNPYLENFMSRTFVASLLLVASVGAFACSRPSAPPASTKPQYGAWGFDATG